MLAIDELREALSFIQNRCFKTVTLALATFDRTEEVPTYRSLNIGETVATDFGSLASNCVRRIALWDSSGDLIVREYNAGYKPDRHEIEWLTLRDDGLKYILRSVPTPVQIALAGDIADFVDRVRFYIVILSGLGGRVVLFRRYSRNKELVRSRNLVMRLMGERYERLEEPTFQFDPHIDAILYRNHLFILKKSNFQHIFRYYEMLRKTAENALDTVSNAVPIDGFEEFRSSCLGHLQKLEKLRNIAGKSYLQNVTMADIKRTIKSFHLGIEVKLVNSEERLVFDRKDRWAILNLLDDAYLGSEMTGLKYETNSKREV